jgi:hypothetical protein
MAGMGTQLNILSHFSVLYLKISTAFLPARDEHKQNRALCLPAEEK